MKYLLFISLFTVSLLSHAQQLTLVDELDLGTFAVPDSGQVATISYDENGNFSSSGKIYTVAPGQAALFELSGYAGNMRLNISVLASQPSTNSDLLSPQQFTIVDYHHKPFVVTNGLGEASFYVGATFRTTGTGGSPFVDTRYFGNFTVQVDPN